LISSSQAPIFNGNGSIAGEMNTAGLRSCWYSLALKTTASYFSTVEPDNSRVLVGFTCPHGKPTPTPPSCGTPDHHQCWDRGSPPNHGPGDSVRHSRDNVLEEMPFWRSVMFISAPCRHVNLFCDAEKIGSLVSPSILSLFRGIHQKAG